MARTQRQCVLKVSQMGEESNRCDRLNLLVPQSQDIVSQ